MCCMLIMLQSYMQNIVTYNFIKYNLYEKKINIISRILIEFYFVYLNQTINNNN